MNRGSAHLLTSFASGQATIAERWTAARGLMAARELLPVAETHEFEFGFARVGEEAQQGNELARLIAVDLIVRLSKFVKRLISNAEIMLRIALKVELPPITLLSESDRLPQGAKPAELRENVAFALKYASGDWVVPYVVQALLNEDRSQRCRLELARQLASREHSINQWLSWMVESRLEFSSAKEDSLENAGSRLRDVTTALADAVKQNRTRLEVSEETGIQITKLCRLLVNIPPNSRLPKQLGEGAAGAAKLLDEIFSVRLTLIVDADAYTVLETFEHWWRPIPYPKQLSDALRPILDKLITGLTLRARWGQKSESLGTRLRQALGDRGKAVQYLKRIAEDESGLSDEVDDWLRGRRRKASYEARSIVDSLRAASNEDLSEAIALLLLDAEEILGSLANDEIELDETIDHARRLAIGVKSLASQRGLESIGFQGDVVEYRPRSHQTVSDSVPGDSTVQIVRPMVVRQRRDGSRDIVIRAIVREV